VGPFRFFCGFQALDVAAIVSFARVFFPSTVSKGCRRETLVVNLPTGPYKFDQYSNPVRSVQKIKPYSDLDYLSGLLEYLRGSARPQRPDRATPAFWIESRRASADSVWPRSRL
jgi:hypothetical protein